MHPERAIVETDVAAPEAAHVGGVVGKRNDSAVDGGIARERVRLADGECGGPALEQRHRPIQGTGAGKGVVFRARECHRVRLQRAREGDAGTVGSRVTEGHRVAGSERRGGSAQAEGIRGAVVPGVGGGIRTASPDDGSP